MEATLAPSLPSTAPRWGILAWLVRGFEWLAVRRPLACAVVGLLCLIIRASMLPFFPVPRPEVHDELSYLLAADTYASGRLANPPHAFPEHFETFHVFQRPAYASKYPPLQGMVLAAGQKLTGIPWAGVFVSVGLMCAAICWMLQGWTTPNLALLGALLFMLRVGVFSYWMNSYWGGAVPAIGGALTLGALVRLSKQCRWKFGAVWALGLAILMHSRPFDGALLGICTSLAMVWWMRKAGFSWHDMARQVVLPAAVVLGISIAALAYDNYRVTGRATVVPYLLYEQQYIIAPMFWAQPLRPDRVYPNAVMHNFFAGAQVKLWKEARADVVQSTLSNFSFLYDFFFGLWPLLIPPLICPYRLRSTEERLTVTMVGVFFVFLALLMAVTPHYAAAIAGLLYLRFLHSIERLNAWKPWGKPIGFAVAVFFVTLFVYQFGQDFWLLRRFGVFETNFAPDRASVTQKLEQQPGKQLVMVRYAPGHDVNQEWVYNRADIDASQIVWARETDPQHDRPFLQYFHDRKIWLLQPDQSPLQLVPYPSESEASR